MSDGVERTLKKIIKKITIEYKGHRKQERGAIWCVIYL
jgi:hypothetical protein